MPQLTENVSKRINLLCAVYHVLCYPVNTVSDSLIVSYTVIQCHSILRDVQKSSSRLLGNVMMTGSINNSSEKEWQSESFKPQLSLIWHSTGSIMLPTRPLSSHCIMSKWRFPKSVRFVLNCSSISYQVAKLCAPFAQLAYTEMGLCRVFLIREKTQKQRRHVHWGRWPE